MITAQMRGENSSQIKTPIAEMTIRIESLPILQARKGLIPTPLNNLQIPHLNSRHGKVWNLKLYPNRLFPRSVYPSSSPPSPSSASFVSIGFLPSKAWSPNVRTYLIPPSTMKFINRQYHTPLIPQKPHLPNPRFQSLTTQLRGGGGGKI